MTDMGAPISIGMGLTQRQKDALAAITAFVGRHGVMPSRRQLAAELGCNANNAVRLIHGLVERGELAAFTPGGALSGFGSDGVAVFVPAHVAAALATHCAGAGERIPAVVADALALHLDELADCLDEDAPMQAGAPSEGEVYAAAKAMVELGNARRRAGEDLPSRTDEALAALMAAKAVREGL